MVFRIRVMALTAIGVLAIASGAVAQQNRSDSAQSQTAPQSYPHGNGTLDSRDRAFLTKSAEGSQLEFATSQLAILKAANPQVVEYALRLLSDHAAYNRRLTLLARQKGITVPVSLNQRQQSELNQLSRLQGAAFDREYIRKNVQVNSADVTDLQQEIQSSQDQNVKTLASDELPTQQQHEQLASALSGRV